MRAISRSTPALASNQLPGLVSQLHMVWTVPSWTPFHLASSAMPTRVTCHQQVMVCIILDGGLSVSVCDTVRPTANVQCDWCDVLQRLMVRCTVRSATMASCSMPTTVCAVQRCYCTQSNRICIQRVALYAAQLCHYVYSQLTVTILQLPQCHVNQPIPATRGNSKAILSQAAHRHQPFKCMLCELFGRICLPD